MCGCGQCLHEVEQQVRAETLALCAKGKATLDDYVATVAALRPRFLRVIGDFKMAAGEHMARPPQDCKVMIRTMI